MILAWNWHSVTSFHIPLAKESFTAQLNIKDMGKKGRTGKVTWQRVGYVILIQGRHED